MNKKMMKFTFPLLDGSYSGASKWNLRRSSDNRGVLYSMTIWSASYFPLSTPRKCGKKQITIIKETPAAYVDNLAQKIISFTDENKK